MPETDFFSLFTDPLGKLSVPYMVTGSAVVVAFGEPRLTNDIDLVLMLEETRIEELIACFPDSSYYCPPEEVLRIEIARSARGHFNIIDHRTGLKADCYLAGNDPFLLWGLEHRKKVSLSGHDVFFAPLEYVIIKKLQFYQEARSEKHLRDIRSLLAISGDIIDNALLQKFIREHRLESMWEKLARG